MSCFVTDFQAELSEISLELKVIFFGYFDVLLPRERKETRNNKPKETRGC